MEIFVSFEIAKKLREKGYPQSRSGKYDMKGACYFEDGRFYEDGCIANVEDCFTAPTISQVLKWLREQMGIDVLVQRGHIERNNRKEVTRYYCVNIYFVHRFVCTIDNDEQDYPTYEQAALAGIKYTIYNLI